MSEKGELLREIRERLRLTQEEMGELLGGYKRGTYKNWEMREPPDQILKKAAELAESNSIANEAKKPYSVIKKLGTGPMIELPVLGVAFAGHGDQEDIEGTIYVPVQFGYDDYGAFLIRGDSMMDILWPGDIAIVRTQRVPKLNDINLVCDPQGGLSLKWVTYENGEWVCSPHNSKYEASVFDEGTFASGYLVGFYRDDGETMEIKHRRAGNLFRRP